MYLPYQSFKKVILKRIDPSFKLNEKHFTFHLQYKHSGTFANRKCEELSYPRNQIMCDPILVTLLKMRPHYSQSSHENATPSSGTSPLASYEEVSTRHNSEQIWACLGHMHNYLYITGHRIQKQYDGICYLQ